MLKILKPDCVDTDYMTDGSGHYLLAIHDTLSSLTDIGERDLKKIASKLELPLYGYRPLPCAKKAHKSKKRWRFCFGGNRSSKTHSLVVDCLWKSLGIHPYINNNKIPHKSWLATTTGSKLSDTMWAKLDPAQGGLLQGIKHRVIWQSRQYSIPAHITFDNGSVITFKSFESGREMFQSSDIDDAYFDEQFSKEIFTETITRIGSGRVLSFMSSMTPIEPMPWLAELIKDAPNDKMDVFFYSLDDQRKSWGGFIEDTEIDITIESWPPEVRETRRFGKFGGFEGCVFQSFNRETHVISQQKEKELFLKHGKIDDNMPVIGGIDWGGANPFVFIWATRIPSLDNDWYIFDELYHDHKIKGGVLLKDLANQIEERNKQWGQYAFTRVWADHDPTDAREFTYLGIPSLKAKKDVTAGIEYMQTLFQPRKHLINKYWPNGRPTIHIAERCKVLISQLSRYRWASGTDNRDPKDEPLKVDDHTCDALRYICFGEKYLSVKPMVLDIPGNKYHF